MRLHALAWLMLVAVGCGTEKSRQGLGGACVTPADCHVGLTCVADDPGGQCTKFCTEDVACGAGALCDPEGKCYQTCNVDSDCPRAATDSRYGCVGTAPRRFCDTREVPGDGGSAD